MRGGEARATIRNEGGKGDREREQERSAGGFGFGFCVRKLLWTPSALLAGCTECAAESSKGEGRGDAELTLTDCLPVPIKLNPINESIAWRYKLRH